MIRLPKTVRHSSTRFGPTRILILRPVERLTSIYRGLKYREPCCGERLVHCAPVVRRPPSRIQGYLQEPYLIDPARWNSGPASKPRCWFSPLAGSPQTNPTMVGRLISTNPKYRASPPCHTQHPCAVPTRPMPGRYRATPLSSRCTRRPCSLHAPWAVAGKREGGWECPMVCGGQGPLSSSHLRRPNPTA